MAYKLLDDVDWEALDGMSVTVEVSANWITFGLKDKSLVRVARLMRQGHRKAWEAPAPPPPED